ncbi:MAG: NACHT domain-containing protein [Streptosporangiaceae bacterium]
MIDPTWSHLLTSLEPSVLNAASQGATRAAGWGVEQARGRSRNARIRRVLADSAAKGGIDSPPITEEISTAVTKFAASPEFLHTAYCLASIGLMDKSDKKTDHATEAIKREFISSFKSVTDCEIPDLIAESIFSSLLYATLIEVTKLRRDGGHATPTAQAEATKMIANISSACARNTELMCELAQVAQFSAFEDNLREQIKSLHGTMRLPHAGTTRNVPYDQLFVTPRLAPKISGANERHTKELSVATMLRRTTRCVILGDPGGGKSTLALKLAYDVACDEVEGIKARVPFFVVLRDYANSARGSKRTSLLEYLEAICRSPYEVIPPPQAIEYLLLNDRAVVIFDGLDELVDTSLRRDVVQAVEGFAYRYPTTPIIVTSRRIGYDDAPLDSDLFKSVELEELSDQQVESYARMWFQLDDGQPMPERQRLAIGFLRESAFVADLRVNPLMLSLMCGIYATENYIPRNRPDVYEKCALLLFDKWDKQRGIAVPLSFDAHVYAAMRALALHMYSQEQQVLKRLDLVQFIKQYLLQKRFDDPDIAEYAADQFIDFCKGRAWVLTDIGHEKYGFTHRTFLEYFSASQLVRLNNSPERLFCALHARIRAKQWDVVAQLALQILGRNVEDGADNFLMLTVKEAAESTVASEIDNLLSFAARALQFIVPRPEVLRKVVSICVTNLAERRLIRSRRSQYGLMSAPPAIYLLTATRELRETVTHLIRDEVSKQLQISWRKEELLSFLFLPTIHLFYSTDEPLRLPWTFWKKWSTENRNAFAKYFERASARYYWIDLIRLRDGQINAKTLLARHGVSALYNYYIKGTGPFPPIAYFIVTQPLSAFRILGMPAKGNPDVLNQMLHDLETELPKIPAPWLQYRVEYVPVVGALRYLRSRNEISDQLTLLLCAPLAEIAMRERDRPSILDLYEPKQMTFRTIFEGRRESGKRAEALQLLSELDLDDSAAEILKQWLQGKISFVELFDIE